MHPPSVPMRLWVKTLLRFIPGLYPVGGHTVARATHIHPGHSSELRSLGCVTFAKNINIRPFRRKVCPPHTTPVCRNSGRLPSLPSLARLPPHPAALCCAPAYAPASCCTARACRPKQIIMPREASPGRTTDTRLRTAVPCLRIEEASNRAVQAARLDLLSRSQSSQSSPYVPPRLLDELPRGDAAIVRL